MKRVHRNHRGSPAWASYAAFAWALAYAVGVRGYQGLGGTVGVPGTFQDPDGFRSASLLAGAVIAAAGVGALALVRPWGLRLPRWLIIVPALTGSAYAVAHAVAGFVTKLMHLGGIIDLDFRGWHHLDEGKLIAWDLLFYEPWFLGLGVLVTLGALHHYRRTGGSRRGAYRLVWITLAATVALSGYSVVLMSRSAELHRQSTMNIVITGATGVIGRHAVQQLINAGHRVTGVTRSARGERALRGSGRPPRASGRLRRGAAALGVRGRRRSREPPHPHPVRGPHGGARRVGRERPAARRGVGGDRPRGAGRRGRPARAGVARLRLRRRRRSLGSTRQRPLRAAEPPRRRWPPRPTRASSSPATRSSCASGSSSAPTAGSRRRTSTRRGGTASRRASAAATRTGRRYGSMTPRPRWSPR